MDLYYDLKEQIKRRDIQLYEQWKAGGFCIDPDILSMYHDLGKVLDELEPEDNEFDGEECPICGEVLDSSGVCSTAGCSNNEDERSCYDPDEVRDAEGHTL